MSLSKPIIQTVIQQIFSAESQLVENSNDVSPDSRFWVIPGTSGKPRWLLPYNPKDGLPGLQFWAPYNFGAQCKWNLLKSTYAMGAISQLPTVKLIGIDRSSDLVHLTDWGHYQSMLPVVYLSESSPRCKAVVFLVDQQSHHCQAVAKFPIGECAPSQILKEASILMQLKDQTSIKAPSLLYQNTSHGITVQELLKVKNTPRSLTQAHIQWLIKLKQTQTTSLTKQANQLRLRFEAILQNHALDHQIIHAYLTHLQDDTAIAATWTHGDFAPWNFKKTNHHHYTAIDWEDARPEGLPLMDLVHFLLIQYYLRGQKLIFKDVQNHPLIASYCKAFQLSTAQANNIYRFLLLDFWCKRLETGEPSLAADAFRYIQPLLEESQ